MKIKSQIITEASGSIGGVTASHNRGGLYLRARTIPTNPGSAAQGIIRGLMAQLTSLWTDVLTADQRAGWDLYAENVPLPDRLGEPRNVGGLAQYVRSNIPRLQVLMTRLDDAPTRWNLGNYTTPTFSALSVGSQNVQVSFDVDDNWVDEDDAAMLLFASKPKNLSINYFKGPYLSISPILGDSSTPPTSPQTKTLPNIFGLDNRIFFRAEVVRDDARLSADTRDHRDSEA